MLLNWCCTLNIFNAEKSVGGDVKKSITWSFFNRITFHLAVRCRTFQEINLQRLKLKFQKVAEKTAKNYRGLLYFAAPGMWLVTYMLQRGMIYDMMHGLHWKTGSELPFYSSA